MLLVDGVPQTLEVVSQPRHLGGTQAYWVCPQCSALRHHLYLREAKWHGAESGRDRPLRPQDRGPNAQKSDTDHTRRGIASFMPTARYTRLRREYVMTWTSDGTGVLVYTILGMFLIRSSIYIPA